MKKYWMGFLSGVLGFGLLSLVYAQVVAVPEGIDPIYAEGSGITMGDYSFAIGKNGMPEVKSKDGKTQLKGKRLKPGESIRATSIEEIKTMTIIRAKGSHYLVVEIGGVGYKFNLPHD